MNVVPEEFGYGVLSGPETSTVYPLDGATDHESTTGDAGYVRGADEL